MPAGFVRHIYCPAYGEPSLVPGLPAGNAGTPQYWRLFAALDGRPAPTRAGFPDPAARLAAKAALLAEPRTTVTIERDGHLHAESRSFLFRFVDDVDIVVDPVAHVYRFRSASRVGRSDLGVNRKRIARISARLALPSTTSK
jgi:hypothetical protein